jgi:hypothetical protein
LESAFEAGELLSRLTSGRFEQVLGQQLYETYRKLAKSSPGHLRDTRVDAVRALLAQLRNDLLPSHVAHAQVRMPIESNSWTAESETDPRPKFPFKLVDASFAGALSTTLRFDQMLNARFWRIGFTFETRELCDAFAQNVVRRAIGRIAGDLHGLQMILERFSQKTLRQALKIVPSIRERRFEHLILDIVNEEHLHARRATLVEDFLEKTDLRVKYAELARRHGARVQVTSTTAPEHHEAKLQAIRLVDEFVFLSPLSLARYMDSLQGRPSVPEISDTSSRALGALWDCFEAKPADVPQLASELKRIMFRALTGTPDSPLGPMVRVPLPIRQLIRRFVETQAAASTGRLRKREKANPRSLALSGDDFDDDFDRNEKRAAFLRALSAGDRIRGHVHNIVDYGAFIDLGCVDGLLHLSGIPGAVNGMIGEQLTVGEEIDVEVLEVDLKQLRISLRISIDEA